MNSLRRMRAILWKEFRQLARDRVTFGMVVMIPLLQLLLFGFAINTDVRETAVAAIDHSQSSTSRALLAAIEASQVANITLRLPSAREGQEAITRGEVRAAIILPSDLEQRIRIGLPAGQWLLDGSDTMVSNAMLRLQEMPLEEAQGNLVLARPVTFEMMPLFNPERRSAVNIVPGLNAIILTMTMILFTALALVRERERGNLELLITTPIHPLELMIGKIVPYIFVGLIQVGIILGLGYLLFHVPLNGLLSQLMLATILFIAASLTLGLLLSTIAKTQLQAMQLTVFILLPSILLSGFMFPYDSMPEAAQWIAEGLPATHYMRMSRGIILRGAELIDLIEDAVWLLSFTAIFLIVSARRFKKRLD